MFAEIEMNVCSLWFSIVPLEALMHNPLYRFRRETEFTATLLLFHRDGSEQ